MIFSSGQEKTDRNQGFPGMHAGLADAGYVLAFHHGTGSPLLKVRCYERKHESQIMIRELQTVLSKLVIWWQIWQNFHRIIP